MTEHGVRIRHGQLAAAAVRSHFAERCFRAAFANDNAADDINAYAAKAFAAETFCAELAESAAIFLLAYKNDSLLAYAKLLAGSAPEC